MCYTTILLALQDARRAAEYTCLYGQDAVFAAAPAAGAMVATPIFTIKDLDATPTANFTLTTYNEPNRFGYQLWGMKRIITSYPNFSSKDEDFEKRLCLAIAMQVRHVISLHIIR